MIVDIFSFGGLAPPVPVAPGPGSAPAIFQNLGNDAVDWLADNDGDGVLRIQEFAFGGNPWISDNTILPGILVEGNTLTVSYHRRTDLAGQLNYRLMQTSDLVNGPWTPYTGPENTDPLEAAFLEAVSQTIDLGTDTRRFVKVETGLTGPSAAE